MKSLEKLVKDAVAADNYKSGTKQVLQAAKSSKLIVLSKSLNAADRAKLDEHARSTNVAICEFDGNSVQLGKLCNKPFRVTAIAIQSGTDAQIKAVMDERGA
ncbi:ribosomal L7Ae/L30e/S12e/Gadd45 family protein [Nitrososphaera sp.]|uniref:ribosomal L7Ae/L30e/S12e/Gadd45 family protein n=1 Tax=Nitrososphaera sp. TaxID=1971748 RepID=UPI002EDBA012